MPTNGGIGRSSILRKFKLASFGKSRAIITFIEPNTSLNCYHFLVLILAQFIYKVNGIPSLTFIEKRRSVQNMNTTPFYF
jgi:hypothetical protein